MIQHCCARGDVHLLLQQNGRRGGDGRRHGKSRQGKTEGGREGGSGRGRATGGRWMVTGQAARPPNSSSQQHAAVVHHHRSRVTVAALCPSRGQFGVAER